MTRKLHRDGEKIKRIAAPHTAENGLVPFGDFLRKALTVALKCVGCGTPEGCVHDYGCPTMAGRLTAGVPVERHEAA